MSQGKKIGFALGGLAGSNAHTVGFLVAAREAGIRPDLISCTSGTLFWLWRWLKGADIKAELETAVSANRRAGQLGVPGIFRDASAEWLRGMMSAFRWPPDPKEAMARLWPAQMWVPTRSPRDFEDIAATFNDHPAPIMFNAFAPQRGVEYLFMNPAAAEGYKRLDDQRDLFGHGAAEGAAGFDSHLPRVVAEPITAAAVEDALWLTKYGFVDRDGRDKERIDGAYIRQFILNEMIGADLLFVVRPQSHRWPGRLPRIAWEVAELETKMWMDSSYHQQVNRLQWINRLVDGGVLDRARYRHIHLVLVEKPERRGFFEFFHEDMDTFHVGRTLALNAFANHLHQYDRIVPGQLRLGAGAEATAAR